VVRLGVEVEFVAIPLVMLFVVYNDGSSLLMNDRGVVDHPYRNLRETRISGRELVLTLLGIHRVSGHWSRSSSSATRYIASIAVKMGPPRRLGTEGVSL
jgi:hypothetical protein